MNEKSAAFSAFSVANSGVDAKRLSYLTATAFSPARPGAAAAAAAAAAPPSRLLPAIVGDADGDDNLLGHAAPPGQSVPSSSSSSSVSFVGSQLPIVPNAGFDFNGPSRGPPRYDNNYHPPFSGQQQQQQQQGNSSNGPWQPPRA